MTSYEKNRYNSLFEESASSNDCYKNINPFSATQCSSFQKIASLKCKIDANRGVKSNLAQLRRRGSLPDYRMNSILS